MRFDDRRRGGETLKREKAILGLISFILVLFIPFKGYCTPEYASQTGKACEVCHVDSTGGGKLTEEGQTFRDDLKVRGLYRPLKPVQRMVRFILGYIHLLTAIIWFGTILYVHLLLKPAYASRGLPRGELLLGWFSILIMALTGTLLTIARVPSWHMLFHTRFGVLLLIKISLFLVMVAMASLVTFFIGPKLRKKKQLNIEKEKQDLSLEEFATFDGQEGRPAYVAYKGKIYDVTRSDLWKVGNHMGKHRAGFDLTEMLKQAPHEEDKICSMPIVGNLLTSGKRPVKSSELKTFYFLAYTNLILVFLIIFVISLWRWW